MVDSTASVAINDPISADIQAVCGAVSAVCGFLSTPEGQLVLKQAREDGAGFRAAVGSAWNGLVGFFKSIA